MTGLFALIAFLEMLFYTKKGCFLKALCLSVLGAGLGWFLLTKLGFALPLTKESTIIGVLLGLPGVLLLSLGQLSLPLL